LTALGRWARRTRMAADTRERHAIVSDLAGTPATVLDVGGVAGEMEAFLPAATVTSLNVGDESADVHFDGSRIPYGDGSFEVAMSLDVLEHIPAPQRLGHVKELARVAARRAILCCPLGTPEHVAAERELATWYRELTGRPHRFLEEHLERGLPTEAELMEIAAAAGGFELRFQGDFRDVVEVFRRGVLARRRPTPRRLTRYAGARLGRGAAGELERRSSPYTNRAFLISPPEPLGP
jgi:hypothetical protein